MVSYFKPLRRKLGVVILALACVFAAAWMRSRFMYDLLWICNSNTVFGVASMVGGLDFGTVMTIDEPDSWGWGANKLTVVDGKIVDPSGNLHDIDPWAFDNFDIEWRRDWAGFHFGVGTVLNQRHVDYMIPYWAIVIPLTTISAWLLLSKPRPKKPAATVAENLS